MLTISFDEYNKNLQSIFSSCSDRGWHDWRATGILCDRVCELLDMAKRDMLNDGRISELSELSCRAFLEWSKAETR